MVGVGVSVGGGGVIGAGVLFAAVATAGAAAAIWSSHGVEDDGKVPPCPGHEGIVSCSEGGSGGASSFGSGFVFVVGGWCSRRRSYM